jgi:hypothetical protein
MATIILSAAGAAIGGSVGGSVLGLSMAAVGRFAGAVIGRSIDQRLMGQGSEVVETGRVNRLRLTGAGEGDAVAQVFGRMRVSGQVIWATEFLETVTITGGGGGKGSAPRRPTQADHSYSVSLAIALCEGEISHVGRIWADGTEVARDDLNLRVYRGTRDQMPDPRIEAVEGAGAVPAYRGTAYVVIEDLELGAYGNRVPQFSFEVCRPAQPGAEGADLDPVQGLRGVAMLPGSGEYALATTPVRMDFGFGSTGLANVNTPSGKADFLTSLDSLEGELPGCGATSLIVSWFGDDLRCGACTIRPMVEQQEFDAKNMPWQVSGLDRQAAAMVARDGEDRPVYGGTPTDASVVEAIAALTAAGQEVMYYPFILMQQMAGNGLPDPYGGEEQPALPWRGRITGALAPGQEGSPDGTAEAEAQVAAFFGTAQAADFEVGASIEDGEDGSGGAFDFITYDGPVSQSPVVYSGPEEWGYRRFILHQAALCKAAGGVESFCIGSEMRGLTQLRGLGNSFPAVQQLIDLAAEVRALLGPEVKIGYAADWTEYFGYQPGDGDRFFHLDPLWADANIDFIGIDNYMPLSDWRDGEDHADAGAGSIYDLAYLQSNIEGGEGYDWYYHSPEARAAQIRTPITDEDHGEAWIWRFKDIRNWWGKAHHERVGGVRSETSTDWVPMSKPIRFAEYGCAAIDKGSNQPNKFVDPKSSESSLPRHSNGRRDEAMQFQYLRAMAGYWSDPVNNPVSEEYGGSMVDWAHSCAWAWDARPFPFFPNNWGLWSDGANYARGHWLNGRMSARTLASVLDEIGTRAGLRHAESHGVHDLVRGYLVDQVGEARGAMQPLMLRYGVDAIERDGVLRYRLRDGRLDHAIAPEHLVRDPEMDGTLEETRGNAAELAGRVRLRFVEADADYEVIAEESVLPDEATHAVSTSEMPLALTRAEGRQTVARWLAEARVASDSLRLVLPPSHLEAGAGDVISVPEEGGYGLFRIDRVEQVGAAQKAEAVRIEPECYDPIEVEDEAGAVRAFAAPVPVTPLFLDLPVMTGEELPHAPHIAVMADPWPGSAALYASDEDANYRLNRILAARTPVGVTQTQLSWAPMGRYDRGDGLFVKMRFGQLESISHEGMLNGGNLCAIGDGTPGGWEVFQFRDADLVAPDTYGLSHRLRGQLGTEVTQGHVWPVGSIVVRLDGSPRQIDLPEAKRGVSRHYRIGPAQRPVDDPAYSHAQIAFDGLGLRPLRPVHLGATGAAGQDRGLGWIRRTRVGGDRWDTPEVPLGEETESYVIRVVQGTQVLREVMVSAPEWTYALAAQAADGVTGAYEVQVAQVSALFGPGTWARLSLEA